MNHNWLIDLSIYLCFKNLIFSATLQSRERVARVAFTNLDGVVYICGLNFAGVKIRLLINI